MQFNPPGALTKFRPVLNIFPSSSTFLKIPLVLFVRNRDFCVGSLSAIQKALDM